MTEPIRILTVFNEYAEPGGESLAVRLAQEAFGTDARFRTRLVTFRSADWKGPLAPPRWRQALRMLRNPEALRRLRAAHEEFRPHVWLLHNTMPVGSAGVLPLAHALRAPVVQCLHNYRPFCIGGYLRAGDALAAWGTPRRFVSEVLRGSWQHSRLATAWYGALLAGLHVRGSFRNVQCWIAPSGYVRDRFLEAGLQPERVFAVPHAWPPAAEHPSAEEGTRFLFLGRLSEAKGVGVLLDAWSRVSAAAGGDASRPTLVVAGDGPWRERVQAAAARDGGLRYAGPVAGAQKEELLRQCSAVVVPSLCAETFGLVVYEACEFGKPVLAARAGALPEIVEEGRTGLLHEPGNAEALSRQMQTLHGRPDLRREMGQAGRRFLEAFASREKWLDRMAGILYSIPVRRAGL